MEEDMGSGEERSEVRRGRNTKWTPRRKQRDRERGEGAF